MNLPNPAAEADALIRSRPERRKVEQVQAALRCAKYGHGEIRYSRGPASVIRCMACGAVARWEQPK